MTDWAFIARKYLRRLRGVPKDPEPNVTRTLQKLRGKIFVDIGAHTGEYAFKLRKNYQIVHAVEPNPEVLERLREKARKYGNIIVHPLALSDRDGETTLYLDRSRPRCSGSADTILQIFEYKPASNPEVSRTTWEHDGVLVKTARYDSLFNDTVDLVKIDVEGAEFVVLEGMEKALKTGRVKNLMVELHNRDRKEALAKHLSSYGYRLKWVDPDHIFAQAHVVV